MTDAGREELDRLLAHGSFDVALRAAIAARGLSLDRIQDRLSRQGFQISLATLSYWQSGQRRPERPASLQALEQLESLLGLPLHALRDLLGPRAPRARSGEGLPKLEELWPTRPDLAELLGDVRNALDTSLRRLTLHDRVLVGRGGRMLAIRCTQVMRAERNGPDRFLLVAERQAGTSPLVTGLRNCRLGKMVTSEEDTLLAAELIFERPLDKGETVLIEFEVRHRHLTDTPAATVESYVRRFRRSVREYVLEVCFHPDAVPKRCEHFTGPPGGEPDTTRGLKIGIANSILVLGQDFGPGHFGIRWYLD